MLLNARFFSGACIFSFAAMLPLGAARGQDGCVEVAFEAGKSETFIFGIAPAEGVVCYRMQAAPGQRYTLKLVNGRNIVLGIPGVNDGVDEISFTARRRLYEIRVTQLMRSITREAFRIRVSLGAPAPRAERTPAGRADENPSERARQRAKVLRYIDDWLKAQNAPDTPDPSMELQFVDLDGDGVSEALAIMREDLQCGATGCPAFVLDLREAKARSLGDFFANILKVLPTSTNGWRDLSVDGKHLTFRDGRYREAADAAPSSPPPRAGRADKDSSDAAILRAKVMRYAAAWLRSSGLPAGAATPEINLVDLNNDGLPEGIGILRGSMTCGTRGCTAFVLDLGPVEARNIGDFTAETLQPLATRTNGWRDLAVNGRRVTHRGGRY
jgi:hypothetical protein